MANDICYQESSFAEAAQVAAVYRLPKTCVCCVGTPSEETWEGFNELPLIKNNRLTLTKYKPSWREKFPEPNALCMDGTGISKAGLDLLMKLLDPCPATRIKAKDALQHAYFTSERPGPQPINAMPTFAETNATVRHPRNSERRKHEEELQERNHSLSSAPKSSCESD
eukprot:GHVU01129560.1.p1 GENE.GHVU01129560.1~~GHVU01129560.1.p1  ORF type:complete len:168 (+),score=28.63 GHVU01129560.1:412-915(+)